jgi:hypothetical protein
VTGLRLSHPPEEAEGQTCAGPRRAQQRWEVDHSRPCRARLRARKRDHGPCRTHHRHSPGQREDRLGEPRLQHAPLGVLERSSGPSVTPKRRQGSERTGITHRKTRRTGHTDARTLPPALKPNQKSRLLEVSNCGSGRAAGRWRCDSCTRRPGSPDRSALRRRRTVWLSWS